MSMVRKGERLQRFKRLGTNSGKAFTFIVLSRVNFEVSYKKLFRLNLGENLNVYKNKHCSLNFVIVESGKKVFCLF